MEDFLRKYKLIDEFTIELSIDKSDFVRRLRDTVDPGDIGIFSGAFEAWQSSNNIYKGEVTNQGFRLRRRKKFFQIDGRMQTVATSTFTEKRDTLSIHTEVQSMYKKMIPVLGIAASIYLFAIVLFLSVGPSHSVLFFVPVILLAHAVFMFTLFYQILKHGVATLKRELEREFVFLANKS